MKNKTLVSILAAATVAAVPAIAAADHDRSPRGRVMNLGEVDTHARDAEDFVPVAPAQYFDKIVIRAEGGVVPLDEVKIQYSDGRIYYPHASGVLRPGERMQIDVPRNSLPIKMIVLDYGHRDRRMERYAEAKVSVAGVTEARRTNRPIRRPAYDRSYDNGYPRDAYDNRTSQPGRWEWRGGVYVRIQ